MLGGIMKKILMILLLLAMTVGCENTALTNVEELTIYTLNDLHGDILDSDQSLSRIGQFLMSEKQSNSNSLILAAGDMFQGTAISNITRGNVVVEMMNKIGFDAMTIGNHEFDWGTDVIVGLKDGVGVDADFPLIAANIFEKATDEPVTWADPYTITTRGDVKIGIIGLIGEGLETSIAPSMIQDYYFKEELPLIEYYASLLRTEKQCDIVIVSVHGNTQSKNQQIANLSGNQQIDAVINAHTHSSYAEIYRGSDMIPMPVIQASSHGKKIGKIILSLDDSNQVYKASADLLTVSESLSFESLDLNAIVDRYNQQINPITSEVLGEAGIRLANADGAIWAADALRLATNTDVAIINTGGIISNAFPILQGEIVTVGHIWKIMPFDNIVKTVDMTVEDFIYSYYKTSCRLSSNAVIYSQIMTLNEIELDSTDIISVATIDYLFDNTNYRYLEGTNQMNTEIMFRDLLIDNLRTLCKDGDKWYGNAQ